MPHLPKLPQVEAAKLARLIREEQIYSVMNNTKWSELLNDILTLPPLERPSLRMRSVFAPAGFITDWGQSWDYDLCPVEDLEWIDMLPDSRNLLTSILAKHNIPYSIEGNLVRVWGYVRPGTYPDWQVQA